MGERMKKPATPSAAAGRKSPKRAAAAKKVTGKKPAKSARAAKKKASTGKKPSPKSAASASKPAGRSASPVRSRPRQRFARESARARRARAGEIFARLRDEYPGATTALVHGDAYQLVVATILSAQCTDERVNQVTPALFRRYPGPVELAEARPEELEDLIRSTGFFRNKTRSLLGMANAVVDRFSGEIPDSMAELVTLPGVGRKTANVVLGNAFGKDEGVVVDTHVGRLSQRLGLTRHTDPVRIEPDLMKLFERKDWTELAHVLILHGRAVCKALKPRCEVCAVADLCPSSRV
jgi:endonuclease III